MSSFALELLAYIFLTLVALALRIGAASSRLLGQEEALRALAAWRFVQGQAPEPSWPLSPVPFGFQALAFLLFGAGDVTARLPAALAGGLIPLTFFPLRRVLGKDRALVAAAISALSPLWIFSSSFADGEAIGALAALVAIGAILWYRESESLPWLYVAACVLGLGMASGLSFWTIAGEGLILALLFREKIRPLARGNAGFWPALGASFLLTSTLLFFYPPGLGLAADSFALWLSSLFSGHFSLKPLVNFLLYEPLLILAAFWGGKEGLYLWALAGFGLTVAIFGGSEGPAGFLPILLPLTILSSLGLCNLFRRLAGEKFSAEELIAFGLSLCLGVWGFLGISAYTLWGAFPYLLAFLGAGVGIVSVLVVLSSMRGPKASYRVSILLLLTAFSLGEIKLARGLNFSPYVEEHLPLCRTTSLEVKEAVDSLRKLSSYRTGDPSTLNLALVGNIPELEWYLRDFSGLRVQEQSQPPLEAEAFIVPAEKASPPGESYFGRHFTVREECRVMSLRGLGLLRWLLYREPLAPRKGEEAVLWVKKGFPGFKP